MDSSLPSQLFRVDTFFAFSDPDLLVGHDVQLVSNCAPAEEVLRRVQDALASLGIMQRSQATLRYLLGDNHLHAGVHASLADNDNAIESIEGFLQACIESFPTSMRPTDHSCIKAEQVFATPELLEAILLWLPPRDTLRAIKLNKAAFGIFKDSPKLQDKLQLRSTRGAYLSNIIPKTFKGMSVDLGGTSGIDMFVSTRRRQFIQMRTLPFHRSQVTISIRSRSSLRFGNRCRSMQIVQPPAVRLEVSVSCCPVGGHSTNDYISLNSSEAGEDSIEVVDPLGFIPAPSQVPEEQTEAHSEDDEDDVTFNAKVNEHRKIRCKTGITVGHVFDAVQTIREAHRRCPHASLSEHAEDGAVWPEIKFSTFLKLRKDDPYLHELDRTDVRERLGRLAKTDKKGVTKIYISSKKRALENKWPIPTYTEFRAKYDVAGVVGTKRYCDYGLGPPHPPDPFAHVVQHHWDEEGEP